MNIALASLELPFHRVAERPHRCAFAHHFERNALADVALRAAVLDERRVGPGHHVDEARSDGEAGYVVLERSFGIADVAQCDDRVAVDRDVARVRRLAAAVVDRPAAKNDIMSLRRCTCGQQAERDDHETLRKEHTVGCSHL